jgi:hypothetical protein
MIGQITLDEFKGIIVCLLILSVFLVAVSKPYNIDD